MRTIKRTSAFKTDYKREERSDADLDEKLVPVLNLLATDRELPVRLRDHALTGQLRGFRDCHIKPDLVLIYSKPEGHLKLVRLGSHTELFQ